MFNPALRQVLRSTKHDLVSTSAIVGATFVASIVLTADISTPATAPSAFFTGSFNIDYSFLNDPAPSFNIAVSSYAPTTDDLVIWASAIGFSLFDDTITLQTTGMSGTVLPIEVASDRIDNAMCRSI